MAQATCPSPRGRRRSRRLQTFPRSQRRPSRALSGPSPSAQLLSTFGSARRGSGNESCTGAAHASPRWYALPHRLAVRSRASSPCRVPLFLPVRTRHRRLGWCVGSSLSFFWGCAIGLVLASPYASSVSVDFGTLGCAGGDGARL